MNSDKNLNTQPGTNRDQQNQGGQKPGRQGEFDRDQQQGGQKPGQFDQQKQEGLDRQQGGMNRDREANHK